MANEPSGHRPDDHQIAADLAEGAGRELLLLRADLMAAGRAPSDIKDIGDAASQAWLAKAMRERVPNDAVLSEEAKDDLSRLTAHRVWIIDPIDGTREFSEDPRTDWAVHVALAIDGVAVVGAVALPALGMTLHTGAPPVVPAPYGGPPRIIVSRTRPPAVALTVADALGGVLVEMGSAGAKAMAVVRGEADVYVHAGGQYEWDSAAPVAVALAAGLHVSRLDGSAMRYNNESPYLPDLCICRPELAEAVLRIVA
jgi:3'(2'), 5'-bisphosphate nucleotidase